MPTHPANATALIVLIALLLGGMWPTFQSPGPPEDEGIALVYPEMFLKGRLPYRDFETIYGPGNLLVLSGSYRLFGNNIYVERAIGLIYRLLILLGIFTIASRFGTVPAIACGLSVVIMLAGSDLFANTWFAASGFALIGMCLANKREWPWLCGAAGLSIALTLLCRCDIGPAILVAMVPLVLAMQRKSRIGLLIGVLIGLSPFLWFAVVIGPRLLIYALFIFPVFELSSSAYLPISSAPLYLRLFFYFSIFVSVLNLTAGFVNVWRKKDDSQLFLAASLFGAGCIYYAISRFDGSHVINATLVSIALLPLSINIFLSMKFRSAYAISVIAGAIGLATIHFVYFDYVRYFYRNTLVTLRINDQKEAKPGQSLEPGDKGFFVRNGDRSFPLGRTAMANFAQQLVTELTRVSAAGQRLVVGPGDLRRTVGADTFFYHLLPLLDPATYYLEMNPGSTNAPGSRLASDLAQADWLILDRSWDNINEPNRSAEFGSDVPNQVVQEKFDLWAEDGPYLLMRNRRLRNSLQLPPTAR